MNIIGYKRDVEIPIRELPTLCGNRISERSISASISRAKSEGKISTWVMIENSAGEKALLYSTIPKQTREKYNLPPLTDLIERIKQENEIKKADTVQQQIDFAIYTLQDSINKAANEEYIKYMPMYHKTYPTKRDKVVQLAKTHAVLQCCMELKPGYTVAELHAAYMKAPGIKVSLKNIEKFRQKLKDAEKGGLNILHKYAATPREYLIKMTDWHRAKIELYYGDPKQYTVKQVSELVYSECLKSGIVRITESTISKYLQQPEVKNRLAVTRNPSLFKRTVKPSTRRIAPEYAGDLYYADGSPIQIVCWNKARTAPIKLNLFVVMDVKSKKIIGFDFAESEDRYSVFSAFKMAFSREMLLPYQLKTDQGSFIKTVEYQELKAKLELKGCRLDTTKRGEGQQKADIERWFNTFQTEFQRLIDAYIGEGIRSKRDNGRIDADFLKAVKKEKDYYSYENMIVIVTELIGIYNQKTVNSRVSPNQVFSECKKANMAAITAPDIAVLFWHSKTLKVKNSEVKFEIRKQQYIYDVYNHEIGLRINNTDVKVYYDENDPSTVHLFNLKNEYLCECRQKTRIVSAAANQTEADILNIVKQSSHNDAMVNTAKKQNENVIKKGLAVDENLFEILDPFTVQKDIYNNAETQSMLNYIYNEKGINPNTVETYAPVDTHKALKTKLTKTTAQERHAKKNIVAATFETIKQP